MTAEEKQWSPSAVPVYLRKAFRLLISSKHVLWILRGAAASAAGTAEAAAAGGGSCEEKKSGDRGPLNHQSAYKLQGMDRDAEAQWHAAF